MHAYASIFRPGTSRLSLTTTSSPRQWRDVEDVPRSSQPLNQTQPVEGSFWVVFCQDQRTSSLFFYRKAWFLRRTACVFSCSGRNKFVDRVRSRWRSPFIWRECLNFGQVSVIATPGSLSPGSVHFGSWSAMEQIAEKLRDLKVEDDKVSFKDLSLKLETAADGLSPATCLYLFDCKLTVVSAFIP